MESLRNAHQLATPNAKVIISFYDYTLLSPKLTVKYEEKAIHFDSMSTLFSSFFFIILRSMYFHIPCTMFLSTGSRSHSNSLWALLLLLIPIVLIIYKGKLLLHSNGRLK